MQETIPIYDFDFTKKIEDMSEQEIQSRMEKAMNIPFKYKIKPLEYRGGIEQVVSHTTNELIGLCPATGFPDIYSFRIIYIPEKYLPELKSLKFYFYNYMMLPISHEHATARIHRDFLNAIHPKKLKVELHVNVRGGIYTTCEVGNSELTAMNHKDLNGVVLK